MSRSCEMLEFSRFIMLINKSTSKVDGPGLNESYNLEFHMQKILNKISGGYNCTCNEGYSGTGRNIEIMDASEVMIQKPGCVKNQSNATQSTPMIGVSTTPRPLIPLVNILYNSTITAQEKSNDTQKELGALLGSNAIPISLNALLLTYYISFA